MIEKLHEKAEKYFNEKADDFLYELKPDPDRQKKHKVSNRESSASHVFVSKHLTDKDIIEFTSTGYVNGFGRQVSRYFFVDELSIGLDENGYSRFEKFAETIYKKREFNSGLSLGFIKDCGFEWFEKQYKGIISGDVKFLNFLTEKSKKAVRSHRISVPISFISIEKHFKIGNIAFEYFTKEFFDKYISYAKGKAQESPNFNENDFQTFEVRIRKRYQGVVFGSITIEAEKQRCIELAKAETEKALMVLRFFSPSAFLPEIPCYFGIMGQTDLPKKYFFIFDNHIPEIQEGIDERSRYIWPISAREIYEFDKLGFHVASNLITKENPNELESLILNSMFLFGRSLTSRDYQDKIVYALVSVETLLLQNQSEPIQSSVGLRLAFLTESEAEKRKSVKDLINRAYKIRSSYIHHGRKGQDWDLLQKLQHTIWTATRNILMSKNRYTTQKDFLDYLERLILS